jgi:pimeloyl-ACP methyl ester carboxylesterase
MNTYFLAHESGKIAYDDTGSGPLVLCAPGMGDLRAEYRFLAPQLVNAGYRVVCMDLRGHGESSAHWPDYSVASIGRDMLALIRSLDAGPAVIIGASFAPSSAVWAAAEAPELAAGLVLIAPFVYRGELPRRDRLLYSALFSRPWGPAVWQWFYGTLYPTRKPADFAQYRKTLRANMAEPGRLEALRALMLASKADFAARLAHLTAPSLVVMGSKDPDFKDPEAEAKEMAGSLHTRYIMVEGAGHYPHAEMPDVTTSLILFFLQTAQPAMEMTYAV